MKTYVWIVFACAILLVVLVAPESFAASNTEENVMRVLERVLDIFVNFFQSIVDIIVDGIKRIFGD